MNNMRSEANSFIDQWLTRSDRDILRDTKTPEEAVHRLLPPASSHARKDMRSLRRAHSVADDMIKRKRYDLDMADKLDDIIDFCARRNLDRERAKDRDRDRMSRPPPAPLQAEPSRSPPASTSTTTLTANKSGPASLPAKPSSSLVEPPLMSRRSSRGSSRSPPRDRVRSPHEVQHRDHKSNGSNNSVGKIGVGFRRVGSGRPQADLEDRRDHVPRPASAAEERDRTGLKRSRPSRWD